MFHRHPTPQGVQIELPAPGHCQIRGELVFGNVPDLEDALDPHLDGLETLTIDLSGVTRADSAGMALMVEWWRRARRAGTTLSLRNTPEQMRNIARVSSLEQILPLD